jgi:serine phosphatase RsbU (regulator of sigma subunit)
MRRLPRLDWLLARPWRVVVLVALVVGLPILVIGEISAEDTRQRLHAEQVRETAVLAERAAANVEGEVQSIVEQLLLATALSDIRPALDAGDSAVVGDLVRSYRRRLTGDIARLFALDRDLNVVTVDPYSAELIGKRSGQSDFLETLRRANLRVEGAVYSDLYASDAGNSPTVSIAVAVLSVRGRAGPFSGALIAELDPPRLASWIRPLLSSADEVLLVDRSGRLIVRASAPESGVGTDLGAEPVIAAALAHRAAAQEANDPFGRGRRFAATSELASLGWHVLVERPTAVLEQAVDQVLRQLLVSRVVLIGVLLVASYVIAAGLAEVRRLGKLEQEHMRASLEQIGQELRIAREIQTTLLPKELHAPDGFDVAALYLPARDVGGDFYDAIFLPDGREGFVVADVTGKGMPAALLMAATLSTLRAEAPLAASPGQLLARVNDQLCREIPPKNFVTCLYAILDPETGNLRFANAGHPLPIVKSDGAVFEAKARGMPLGLVPGSPYEESEIVLADGARVLFYTDGMTEAHSAHREMFGCPRLRQLLVEAPSGGMLLQALRHQLELFTGPGWVQEDDVTLLTLERIT